MAKLQDYLDQVNVFSALKEEPEWMLELRQAALAKVDELPVSKNVNGSVMNAGLCLISMKQHLSVNKNSLA